jgi:hypothetical protein
MGTANIMLPDTLENIVIKPWTFSRNRLPTKTQSDKCMIKCGSGSEGGRPKPDRIRARRKKHLLTYDDGLRMLVRLVPPEDERQDFWTYKFIAALKDATIKMLERMLIFVPDGVIEDLYYFGIGIIDKLLGKVSYEDEKQSIARTIINEVARKANLYVSFEEE